MGYARISLAGRVYTIAERRFTPSGKEVCKFSLGVGRKVNNEPRCDWYSCTCWESMVDAACLLEKGDKVKIEGRLTQREYQAKDGSKRISMDVTVDKMEYDTDEKPSQEQVPF